jgi:4-hydroxy-3-methylbut-2-en-1-yl diphosphate reductase
MSNPNEIKIVLANPRGFCAGVDRAIDIVERAIELFGAPIYVKHEVVHNKFVVDELRNKGAVFVEELDEIPDDTTVIFSAHGVSQAVRKEAAERKLKVFDATCPLVTKVHMEVTRYSKAGHECILIGHVGHPEVEGTMGQFDVSQGGQMYLVEDVDDVNDLEINNPDHLSYVTQTTLSMDDTASVIDALRQRFPNIHGPKKDDICYATQNRQDAVKDISAKVELLLVVGSKNSSNSNRLRELAVKHDTTAYLIDNDQDIDPNWLTGVDSVGVTAGASAPEILVQQVIEKLVELTNGQVVENPGIEENTVFAVPVELR